ncbi:MAG: methyltransferase [Candidatus Velthaea sp.]
MIDESVTNKAGADDAFFQLMQIRDAGIIFNTLCAAAKLQLADHIERGLHSTAELARELHASDDAVYRTLRALASRGIFEETTERHFANTELSRRLITGVPGSMRSAFLFWGTEFFSRSFAAIEHSIVTGEPAATKVFGSDGWESMRRDPELAAIFDDAMTSQTTMQTPAIVDAYDFERWGTIADIGGGNGYLLAQILHANPQLHGVLADQPHVIKRASERGLLSEVASRVRLLECDFFQEVPVGARAYVMKYIIHDWADAEARAILRKCREAVPADGALLLIEWEIAEANRPSVGKMSDLIMLVMNGGKERTPEEYGMLLEESGFRLHRVIPTRVGLSIFEALPI